MKNARHLSEMKRIRTIEKKLDSFVIHSNRQGRQLSSSALFNIMKFQTAAKLVLHNNTNTIACNNKTLNQVALAQHGIKASLLAVGVRFNIIYHKIGHSSLFQAY